MQSISSETEELLQSYLNFVVENCDIEKLIQSKKFWKVFKKSQTTQLRSIFNNLLKQIYCSTSGCTKRKIALSCEHSLCIDCYANHHLQCPELSLSLNKYDKVLCLQCLKYKKSSNYASDSCMHICKQCMSIELFTQDPKCFICSSSIKNSESLNEKCSFCLHQKPSNMCVYLPCRDIICETCLPEAITPNKKICCPKCKEIIPFTCLLGIKHLGKFSCEICRNYTDYKIIKKLTCCGKKICPDCDQGNQYNCSCAK